VIVGREKSAMETREAAPIAETALIMAMLEAEAVEAKIRSNSSRARESKKKSWTYLPPW